MMVSRIVFHMKACFKSHRFAQIPFYSSFFYTETYLLSLSEGNALKLHFIFDDTSKNGIKSARQLDQK